MYRKSLIKIFLTGSLAVAATCAVAQSESASLSVSGTLRPAACTLSLANDGAFDYGTVPSDQITNATFYNALDAKETGFTVSCTALAKVALKSADNRAGTIPFNSNVSIFGDIWSPQYLHGLGQSNGKKIGGYGLTIGSAVQADGANADVILQDSGRPWEQAKSGALTPNDRLISWRHPDRPPRWPSKPSPAR